MKKVVIAIAMLAGLPLAAQTIVAKEDIRKLVDAGMSDKVRLSWTRTNGFPERSLGRSACTFRVIGRITDKTDLIIQADHRSLQ